MTTTASALFSTLAIFLPAAALLLVQIRRACRMGP